MTLLDNLLTSSGNLPSSLGSVLSYCVTNFLMMASDHSWFSLTKSKLFLVILHLVIASEPSSILLQVINHHLTDFLSSPVKYWVGDLLIELIHQSWPVTKSRLFLVIFYCLQGHLPSSWTDDWVSNQASHPLNNGAQVCNVMYVM